MKRDRPRISGWCNDGFHAGTTYRFGSPCPRGPERDGSCECSCHEESA